MAAANPTPIATTTRMRKSNPHNIEGFPPGTWRALAFLRNGLVPLLFLPCLSCSQLFVNARHSDERPPAASGNIVGRGNLALCLTRSTVLSAVHHPVTTVKLGAVVLWSRPREIVSANLPVETAMVPAAGHPPGSPAFERSLDESGMPAGTPREAQMAGRWRRVLHRTRPPDRGGPQVHRHPGIHLRQRRHRRALRRPAEAEVERKSRCASCLTTSETPSRNSRHRKLPRLPDSRRPRTWRNTSSAVGSVSVRRTPNPWLVCDHTKLFVFDRRTAIIGGMNIGREYFSEWHDLMVRVEGPAVETLARSFDKAWRHSRMLGDLLPQASPPRNTRRKRPTWCPCASSARIPARAAMKSSTPR